MAPRTFAVTLTRLGMSGRTTTLRTQAAPAARAAFDRSGTGTGWRACRLSGEPREAYGADGQADPEAKAPGGTRAAVRHPDGERNVMVGADRVRPSGDPHANIRSDRRRVGTGSGRQHRSRGDDQS